MIIGYSKSNHLGAQGTFNPLKRDVRVGAARLRIHVFRLLNPVYAMNTYIRKVDVFTQQANYESNRVFVPSLRACAQTA